MAMTFASHALGSRPSTSRLKSSSYIGSPLFRFGSEVMVENHDVSAIVCWGYVPRLVEAIQELRN